MKKIKNNIFRLQKAIVSMLPGTLLSISLFLMSVAAFAQSGQADEVAMADGFRAEGKIYVVVAVILLIFAGLVIYAVSIDRKISRIEKEVDRMNK